MKNKRFTGNTGAYLFLEGCLLDDTGTNYQPCSCSVSPGEKVPHGTGIEITCGTCDNINQAGALWI
jgi:hypothetical protein